MGRPVEACRGAAVVHVDQVTCRQGLLQSCSWGLPNGQNPTGSEPHGEARMESSSIIRQHRSLSICLLPRGMGRRMEKGRILTCQNIYPKGIKKTPMSELTLRTDFRVNCLPSMGLWGVFLRGVLSLILTFARRL